MAEPTPRDTLLDHAYEIADKYGLAALSVRGLASDCNVSVGTIYNHFASKGELTTATTALYFKRAFYTDFCHPTKGERYLDFCKRMFDRMEKTIHHFREHWLKDSEALPTAEKTRAIPRRKTVRPYLRGYDYYLQKRPLHQARSS